MKWGSIFLLFVFILAGLINASAPDRSTYWESLDQYGEWIKTYSGITAWVPNYADDEWYPYTDGRWEWTRHGWYWVSYEPFGWATYHYGRWDYTEDYGWIWFPDGQWGPSWVEWRFNDDFIGWTPISPYAVYDGNSGFKFTRDWFSEFYKWTFISFEAFTEFEIYYYFIDPDDCRDIFEETVFRLNYQHNDKGIVNEGVSIGFIEKKSGYDFNECRIETTSDLEYSLSRNMYGRGDVIYRYVPSSGYSHPGPVICPTEPYPGPIDGPYIPAPSPKPPPKWPPIKERDPVEIPDWQPIQTGGNKWKDDGRKIGKPTTTISNYGSGRDVPINGRNNGDTGTDKVPEVIKDSKQPKVSPKPNPPKNYRSSKN